MNSKKICLTSVISLILIGFSFHASAQEEVIPSWIKNTAAFWSSNQISDSEFISALQFLVEKNILIIPQSGSIESIDELFPNKSDVGNTWIVQNNSDFENFIPNSNGMAKYYTNPSMSYLNPEVNIYIFKLGTYEQAKSEFNIAKSGALEVGLFEVGVPNPLLDSDRTCWGYQELLEEGQDNVFHMCIITGQPYLIMVETSGNTVDSKSGEYVDWSPTNSRFMEMILSKI